MELFGKLVSNNNTNIGIIPIASKDVFVKFADKFPHILKNKETLNGLKCSTKIQNIESQFKYQSRIYTVQSNSDVNHRGIKMIWNNKLFPSLNVINGKTFPYGSKGILKHYHYRSYPKLGPGIFEIRMIPFSYHAFTTTLSLSWYSKIE